MEAPLRAALAVVAVAQGTAAFLAVKSASKASARARIKINDQLAPLIALLKLIPTAPAAQRRQNVSTFLAYVTAACISLAEGPRLRATFFEVVTVEGSRVFKPSILSYGRGDPPVSEFREGDDGEGDEVWNFAETGRHRHEPDIRKNPPAHMDSRRARTYRSFITVPVRVNQTPVGLLTINSPKKRGLTVEDVALMQIMADLCAAAIAANNGKCPPLGA